jgi:hypothetical protein
LSKFTANNADNIAAAIRNMPNDNDIAFKNLPVLAILLFSSVNDSGRVSVYSLRHT